jgi:hypothetical protein
VPAGLRSRLAPVRARGALLQAATAVVVLARLARGRTRRRPLRLGAAAPAGPKISAGSPPTGSLQSAASRWPATHSSEGLLYPAIVFGLLFLWPNLERAVTKDRPRHHLLDRPRDAPRRTAIGVAALVNVIIVFVAGASDRVLVEFGFDYVTQIRVFQVLIFAGPLLAYWLTKRICVELRRREADPLTPRAGRFVRRLDDGSFIVVPEPAQEDGGRQAEEPVRGSGDTGGPS